jgi:hypothetical protein
MRILVEGSKYKMTYLKDELLLNGKFYELKGDNSTEAKITSVGYHRNINGEIIYMLPKVFRGTEGIDDKNKLESKIKHNDIEPWARKLTVYFHRGLEIYNKKVDSDKKATENSSKLNSKNGSKEYTYWELVDSFYQFYLRNKNTILFRHIKHISNQARKTNWERTVRKSNPIIDNSKKPIYIELHNKKKIVNYEEELIIIFFSILNFFNEEHVLDIKIDKVYNIVKGSSFKSLKRNGKGKLRKIKHRYYSDVMKQMFSLCEIYFKINDTSTLKKGKPDFMAVNKYNTVFEAMLERLLVGDVNYLEKNKTGFSLKQLKYNRDGKIIDHIYKDVSLINEEDYIYFIADAKYYSPEIINEEDEEVSKDESDEEINILESYNINGVKDSSHSLYKQYTYAKNTIQFNIELFYQDDKENQNVLNKSKIKLERINYRDEITEGYNITPNYFIYGYTDKYTLENLNEPYINYNNSEDPIKVKEKDIKIIKQWPFRLFDRDTLIATHFKMSFPYVLKSYVSKNSEYLNRQRNIIRKQFRNIFINSVQQYTQYKFYKIGFSKISLDEFVNRNFKILNGKCFSVSLLEDKFTLIIAIHNLDINFKKFIEEQIDNLNDYTYKFGDDDFNAKEMPKEPIIPLEMPSIAAEEESRYNK